MSDSLACPARVAKNGLLRWTLPPDRGLAPVVAIEAASASSKWQQACIRKTRLPQWSHVRAEAIIFALLLVALRWQPRKQCTECTEHWQAGAEL